MLGTDPPEPTTVMLTRMLVGATNDYKPRSGRGSIPDAGGGVYRLRCACRGPPQ